ncbi:uncharacterized protein PAC_12861 [Phialocephala subalpina]|uniref:F-box domain-containing protein n=1 Tax=Phialocephala subalpina TaxID=576137 RepID=A0A1L7XD63_9HELO|nr:uncharacterized protein PAC_12861 [Phialocephala subalpina]
MSCSCCSPASTKGFDPFIDGSKLESRCRLDNTRSRFKSPMVRPEDQESSLQKLPIEVYHNVLQYLDIGTLTSMRAVSQYTRASIDSLHPYKELHDFAPQALRACLSTEMAPHIPLLRLHNALTTQECHYCKQTYFPHSPSFLFTEPLLTCIRSASPESTFGTHLSLWEGHRICVFCARNSPSLKPAELNHLLTLCASKKSSVPATSLYSIPKLRALPGTYSTASVHETKRFTLMLPGLITAGKTLSDREARILNTDTSDSNTIYHHPFVRSEDESDISPSIGYLSPETDRLVSFRYTTILSLPFLNPTTKKFQHGILCQECCLRMRYTERMWKAEQRHRRQTGRSPVASNARRRVINGLRREASKYYAVAHESDVSSSANGDVSGGEKGKGKRKAGEGDEMSIQEHYREVHIRKVWEIGPHEEAWRNRHKGPALPLLRNEDFWQPPVKKVKIFEDKPTVEVKVAQVAGN